MRCSYQCTANHYHIQELAESLKEKNWSTRFYDDVLHVNLDQDQDAFIFSYGCVVFWNVDEVFKEEIFSVTQDVSTGLHKLPAADGCYYVYGDQTIIHEEEDRIELESDDLLIRLSISHGLAQSVKLETFERSVLNTIEKTRPLTQQIRDKGTTSLSRKKLSQLIGELFQERNFVNLDCDLLDTPEFFWRRPGYEAYYHEAAVYVDIKARLDIMNRRMDAVHDLYDFLSNELNHSHSSFLEWIIICLIVSEVILTLLKDIFKII